MKACTTSACRRAARVALLGLAAATCLPALAADLLGSTLTFSRRYADVTTPYFDTWFDLASAPTSSTIVSAGAADVLNWNPQGKGNYTSVDPGASSVVFTLPIASDYTGTGGVFDGYRITGIPFDIASVTATPSIPAGLAIATSFSNLGPRTIDVNLYGSYAAGTTFTVSVTPVPEPEAYLLALTGLAVTGLIWRRGRRESSPAAAA